MVNLISFSKLIILSTIVLLIACNKGDIPLTLVAKPITSNILRFDGYYYFNTLPSKGGEPLQSVFFFYKNGVMFFPFTTKISDVPQSLKYLTLKVNLDAYQKDANKDAWGIFTIEGKNIEHQRLYDGGSSRRPMKYCKGTILNDTTFLISGCTDFKIGNAKDKTFTVNDTFHFKRFSPKIDSLNPWYK